MNKKQKIIIIILCVILILETCGVFMVKSKKPTTTNNKVNNIEKFDKNISMELITKYNNLMEDIYQNMELEQETNDIQTYKYIGDTPNFIGKLDSVYLNPFYENEMFDYSYIDGVEIVKMHIPNGCKLVKVDPNSKLSSIDKRYSTIVIGDYEYTVEKDTDNIWKFPIPVALCE